MLIDKVFREVVMLQARSPFSTLQLEVEARRGVSMSVVEVWLMASVQCNRQEFSVPCSGPRSLTEFPGGWCLQYDRCSGGVWNINCCQVKCKHNLRNGFLTLMLVLCALQRNIHCFIIIING
ncbi:hypothetical protein FHG87_000171 [Trinorchestia longiramus]|nr:hypothetical protein FHG87_000171 [Trinorchestia longiramus]